MTVTTAHVRIRKNSGGIPLVLTSETTHGVRIINLTEHPRTAVWPWGEYQDTDTENHVIHIRSRFLNRALHRLDHEGIPEEERLIAFHEEPIENGQTRITWCCRADQGTEDQGPEVLNLCVATDARIVDWPASQEDWRDLGAIDCEVENLQHVRTRYLYEAILTLRDDGVPDDRQQVAFHEHHDWKPGRIFVRCVCRDSLV
jgi:hypothetical protein